MTRDGCNYFSFWAIFSPSKFCKNKKNHGDIIILHMYTRNYDQNMCGS